MPAKNQTRAVTPPALAEDERGLAALTQIANYQPANPDCTLDRITSAHAEMLKTRELKTNAETALLTATDHYTAATWTFHNLMLQVKNQIRAQFGPDSVEIQAIGLKRSSERKRPTKNKEK